jgi:hypothetical protein
VGEWRVLDVRSSGLTRRCSSRGAGFEDALRRP